MNIEGIFTSASRFRLERALLIYRNGQDIAATTHEIKHHPDAPPELHPGTPVTRESVAGLVEGLGRHITHTLLPERVIYVSHKHLAWWSPSVRRRIWFKPALHKGQEAEEARLRKLNGKIVRHPTLLFIAGNRQLQVLALARDSRPDATTKLHIAPYFNLDADGYMCIGSARLPQTLCPTDITAYEDAFYDSAFSHSNGGHKLTRHAEGHAGLWDFASLRSFTTHPRWLVPYCPPHRPKPRTWHTLDQLITSLK